MTVDGVQHQRRNSFCVWLIQYLRHSTHIVTCINDVYMREREGEGERRERDRHLQSINVY